MVKIEDKPFGAWLYDSVRLDTCEIRHDCYKVCNRLLRRRDPRRFPYMRPSDAWKLPAESLFAYFLAFVPFIFT